MAEPADGRQRIRPLSKFEEQASFTRAIRVGSRSLHQGMSAQSSTAVSRRTSDVRVRMFVTDIKDAEAVTAAFTKAVGHARPTGTLVAVAALAGPMFKVEIEAEAVVASGQ